jgi:hypothetical protein
VGEEWQSTQKLSMQVVSQNQEPDVAAGTSTFYNPELYRNQFGYEKVANGHYSGIKHTDDELVLKLRQKLAQRGARGMIGIQRIFKILDDDNSGALGIQEFWKGLCDFRLKFSQEECRHLFELFDESGDG